MVIFITWTFKCVITPEDSYIFVIQHVLIDRID